jgi:high-affinity nickel-transport protein
VISALSRIFDDATDHVRRKVVAIYVLLIMANGVAWVWALACFHKYPLLLGTALLAYTLGLRHAFDADHIAAIDNVTRKLMHEGKRPIAVGLFFSLGHSTVVVALSIVIALATATFADNLEAFQSVGGFIGTSVSAMFLFVVAIANFLVLICICRAFRSVKNGDQSAGHELDSLLANRGLLGRLFRRFFGAVEQSRHMYAIGLLFGLGFDTATEVGLLGISASQASEGLSIWSLLVFPALFTAGMTLLDTTDSVLMSGAYGWAFVKPIRKLYYNMTLTAMSVAVAVLIGGIQVLRLIGDALGLSASSGIWDGIREFNENFGIVGCVMVAGFSLAWLISYIIYRLNRYDRVESDVR